MRLTLVKGREVIWLDGQPKPAHDEVRRILVAAADVIFSDGVSNAFLDHWTDETLLLLSIRESSSLDRRDAQRR